MSKGPISQFIEKHYLHFNAAALVDAAKGYESHLLDNGKMLISLAGAMSTAELGKSLAEMIRQEKVHIISCTGANLEEDIMNLVAHNSYKRVPNYRDLSPQDEWDLLENHFNRVTDTCIPEEEAFRRLQQHLYDIWNNANSKGERYFPHEFMYQMINSGVLKQYYEIDPKDSWMVAAAEINLPIVVPGWEDSTMGNIFASYCIKGEFKPTTMKSGIEYMMWLADWYPKKFNRKRIGLLPNWRRNCWRFSNLCSTHVIPRYGNTRCSILELFLPNIRLHYKLWFLLWCGSKRKNHLGKT